MGMVKQEIIQYISYQNQYIEIDNKHFMNSLYYSVFYFLFNNIEINPDEVVLLVQIKNILAPTI